MRMALRRLGLGAFVLIAATGSGLVGQADAQRASVTPSEDSVFYLPVPKDGGTELAPGEQPKVVWVRCLATADHHLAACAIEDATGLSERSRARVLDWAARQPLWTKPNAAPGESVRLRVSTGPIPVTPVSRPFSAVGKCAWKALSPQDQAAMVAVYSGATAESPIGRADLLRAKVRDRQDLQEALSRCDSAKERHPTEFLTAVFMHLLSEVAAMKLRDANLPPEKLDKALEETPSVRDWLGKLALAMFYDGPTPTALDWTEIYEKLGILERAHDLHPRTYVVDYYVGRAIEAHAVERVANAKPSEAASH